MADRPLYGGEAPGATGGEIHAGKYRGPETEISAPWKCPACGIEQTSKFGTGCPSCGAGQPGVHVGVQRPIALPAQEARRVSIPSADLFFTQEAALAWTAEHPTATLEQAFLAGYRLARVQHEAHMMRAAPVTADLAQLAPAGKPRRTILAALLHFRDRLAEAVEEVSSGEWCSVVEVDRMIEELQELSDD